MERFSDECRNPGWEYYEAQFKASTEENVVREMPQVIANNPGKGVRFDYDCHWFVVSDSDGVVKVVHLGGYEEHRKR